MKYSEYTIKIMREIKMFLSPKNSKVSRGLFLLDCEKKELLEKILK